MKKIQNALLAIAVGMASLEAGAGEVIAISPKQQQMLGIVVGPVSPAYQMVGNRLPGEIRVPVGQERIVSAPQSGLVDALYVAAGQDVKQGQALAHITSPDLVALQRDYLQSVTQINLARNSLARDEELFKDGIISERRYLSSKSRYEELKADLGQRRQTLKLAGMSAAAISRLEQTGEFSSGLTITAPIGGQVLEQLVTSGQRVDMAMPLLRVGRLDPLWLEIHAPVEAFGTVTKGTQVRIPKYDAEGRIITIVRNINRNDQTMHMRAEITRNSAMLSPGQFVEAEIVLSGQAGSQFSVPKAAVIRNGPDLFVFVQTGTGFEPRQVKVISEQSDHVVISGVKGDDRVAVSGTVAIKAAWIGAGGE